MGIKDNFRKFMGIPQDDEFEEEEEMEILTKERSARSERQDTRPNKVVNINTTTQLQVVLVKPENFEDARTVAEHLNSKNTIVLNLEATDKDISRRLMDFLSGVAYANNAQIKRVANSTYIITPYNVNIMGDILDELESNGVYF